MEAARRAAALSPTDETALRRLMLLLERVGDRATAVRAYEAFAWKLEGEYELEPSAEIQAWRGLRDGEIRAEPARESGGRHRTHGSHFAAARSRCPASSSPDPLGRVAEPKPVSLPSRGPRPAAIVAGAVVMLLLLGLAGLYLRTQAGDRTFGAAPPPAGGAAPGVAVLPFAVQDGSLAHWREGLVHLVSIDLSGVPGLRSVDSRTCLRGGASG